MRRADRAASVGSRPDLGRRPRDGRGNPPATYRASRLDRGNLSTWSIVRYGRRLSEMPPRIGRHDRPPAELLLDALEVAPVGRNQPEDLKDLVVGIVNPLLDAGRDEHDLAS